MKKTAFIVILLFSGSLILLSSPGDTIFVKTFTFDSIHTRRGTFLFPEDYTAEKILMYYTIKCDAATPWDSYPCGEWDYTTYTNIYEHTGMLDSTTFLHKKYTLNNNSFDAFNGLYAPTYHKTEIQFNQTTYNFTNEIVNTVGVNQTYSNSGFKAANYDTKTYMLFNADELISSGMTAGEISGISLQTQNLASFNFPMFVKMSHTQLNEIYTGDLVSLNPAVVFYGQVNHNSEGLIRIDFNTPFVWDGESSVIIELSSWNLNHNFEFLSDNTLVQSVAYTKERDYFMNFENYSFVNIPQDVLPELVNEISICLWVYGNESIQPQNDMLFEALDANGQRQLCVHYPWSNGSIYWDAGNNNNSYDRIEKAALTNEYEGNWTHLAFTKNALTGSMKIYINGQLWHSGTGKTSPIQNIETFILGCDANLNSSYSYDGFVDDFSIWEKELSSDEIQQIMYQKPDAGFPAFENLLAYYDFDQAPGEGIIINDISGNNQNAEFWGTLSRKSYKGTDRFKNFETNSIRPIVNFYSGEFTYESNQMSFIDSVMLNQQILREFENVDFYSIGNIAAEVYYPNYELNTDLSQNTDTLFFTPDLTITNSDLTYYSQAFEIINTIQVQNYVTPYGINLNLGLDGFTHIYDVTDYQQFLKGLVDISSHNTQELLDLSFAIIEGTPSRNVLQFNQVYLGNFGQYNIVNDISLQPVKVKRHEDAVNYRLKTRTTGHGMEGVGNCAEFCPTYHNVSIEGEQQFEWNNWTGCAGNPIFPQGGTWIFDRAGWCPGSFANTYDWEITPFVLDGDSILIDYGMTQHPVGNGEGNYNISVQLIQYSAPNFVVDAAIEDVIAPNKTDIYKRYNPICKHPEIIIRNNGSSDLLSVFIEYGINGDYSYQYQWTGELPFLETDTVVLPVIEWEEFVSDNNIFNVRLSNPNQSDDEYEPNNHYSTIFETPDIYTVPIVLVVRTNNFGDQTHYTLSDSEGNLIIDRDNLSSNTTYNDTLNYPAGCYELKLYDRGEDGLRFWYWQGEDGTGYVKFRQVGGGFIKNFTSDFGSFIYYQFIIPDLSYINETESKKQYFEIFPNPNTGRFKVKLYSQTEDEADITITDISGRLINQHLSIKPHEDIIEINLENISSGVYFINLKSGDINKTQKFIIE
ncbi:MAG TPA: peptide-N-glycosidase F-related protein [Bacteroidales bacterium]|nr:peptide-N-glycosidase F-related protein [Bacteroidales bacterium]